MSIHTIVGVDEYLKTSFEDADCDYVDGEVLERNMGEGLHSDVQAQLIILLSLAKPQFGITVRPEIRVRIRPTRYRVADVAVWRAGPYEPGVPTLIPMLVVEILSPEDRMSRMLPRIYDYLEVGVETIWLIDPYERKAFVFTPSRPGGMAVYVLQTVDTPLSVRLADVLHDYSE